VAMDDGRAGDPQGNGVSRAGHGCAGGASGAVVRGCRGQDQGTLVLHTFN